jgi:M6 family metalloprotease-like protein
MMRRGPLAGLGRWLLPAILCGVAFPVGFLGTQAQEPGARGWERGLPPAYYQRLAQNPAFFSLQDGWIAKAAGASQAAPLSGTLPLLVILALHSDTPEPWVAPEAVQAALFDGPSPYGTVSEYYQEVSGGRLRVEGVTLPWVRTGVSRARAVGSSYGMGSDAATGEFLLQALAAADTLVDLGLFDNDGPDGIPNSGDDDGRVDVVAFEFLEVSASCDGPGIWPHRGRIRNWNRGQPFVSQARRPNGSPILVDDYIIQSVVDCTGARIQNASTISHELGHVLGLPDLYDRSLGTLRVQRRWAVGCWSLMAAGSGWGCGSGPMDPDWRRPTHLTAYEKERMGWLGGMREVGNVLGETVSLRPIRTSEEALKIPLQPGVPPSSAEYLLVEYRTKEGFDLDLPSSGVVILHIDPKVSGNQPCATCSQTYRVALLEADGNDGLRRTELQGGNRGEPGDAWGPVGPGRLSARTYPSTRLNSGAPSPVTIYEVFLQDGLAHLTLSTAGLSQTSLLQEFLDGAATPLTAAERAYLDARGNGNGKYDVGDLRAYLRR